MTRGSSGLPLVVSAVGPGPFHLSTSISDCLFYQVHHLLLKYLGSQRRSHFLLQMATGIGFVDGMRHGPALAVERSNHEEAQ